MPSPSSSRAGRVVVYTGAGDGFDLPPARRAAEDWIQGGARSLHELAFAAAATGRHVELRGPVLPTAFDSLAAATGLAPELPPTPARSTAGDIVVIPEGETDPLSAGRVVLSPARVVLLVLAPPGLFGWPYTEGWAPQPPLTVERDSLARPEHFRAASALGMTVWTPMMRVRELSHGAGVPCRFIGNGSPLEIPESVEKSVDVAWLRANRWAPLAEQLAARLPSGLVVDAIEEVEHDELLRRLAAARVLLWPSRIEGHGRISTEARSVGCVPVALSQNDFATGLDAGSGAIVVDTLEAIAEAADALLGSPDELAELASRGRRSAREQLDWDTYVARVDEGLAAVEKADALDGAARAVIGDRVADLLAHKAAGIAEHERRSAELDRRLADAAARESELRAQLEELDRTHARLRGRKAVRFALRAAAIRPRRR
jgi:hypothetical protein